MKQKIQRLSTATIDKIAAGEVIESPSSVVKELVENSIDAHAAHINIEIQSGGFQLIRISDDGDGMSRNDALICVERHATSKLRHIDDLNTTLSMGFRGEALSSIAAVSQFSLITNNGGDVATKLTLSPQMKVSDFAREKGTTVEVASLFYNVPARKKFQKSAAALLSEITKLITKLSIAYPHIAFQLVSNGDKVIGTQANEKSEFLASLSQRIRDVLPSNYSEKGCRVDYQDGIVTIKGVVGLPTECRTNRTGQYLFINQRAVFSPYLSAVMQDAYSTRIESKEHPIFVLHLTLNPELVDVNVHPQKREVRLSSEREIMNGVKRATLKALAAHEQIEPDRKGANPIQFDSEAFSEPLFTIDPIVPKKMENGPTLFEVSEHVRLKELARYGKLSLVECVSFNETFPAHAMEEGILVCDRDAIARTIAYDALLANLMDEGQKMSIQALMFPISIELSKSESLTVNEALPIFNALGIGLRAFGDVCFVVESLAAIYDQDDIVKCVFELLPLLKMGDRKAVKLKEIAKMATRHVESISGDLHTAVDELLKCSSPFLSPSGRGTIAHLTNTDLNALFMEKPCRKRE